MKLLHNVGTYKHSNYNTRDEILACYDQLSFDGVYQNVWENRDILLNRKQSTILFVMWAFVGKDNSFDATPNKLPLEQYCDWNQLMDLVMNYNCVLGSHSWTHRDMTRLSDSEIWEELISPIPVDYFAYPYGNVDARVAALTAKAGYRAAFSVNQGDGGSMQLNRSYL